MGNGIDAAEGEPFGEVINILSTGEVHVKPGAKNITAQIGDKFYVRSGGKALLLQATFPMLTFTKCVILGDSKSIVPQLAKGMPVYRYFPGAEKEEVIQYATGDTKTVNGMELVFIKGGSFKMGYDKKDGQPEERPMHKVTVSDFWIGKYEVTQKQFYDAMGYNPAKFSVDSAGKIELRGKGMVAEKLPVESVSWIEAAVFCNTFSKHSKIDQAYVINITKKQGSMLIENATVTLAEGKNGFRLPTEAEWEYACSAGSTKFYYWGDYMNNDYCWWDLNSDKTTHPVGLKKANAWGLYDMLGNVAEWCWDYYQYDYYAESPEKDPTGPDFGVDKIQRGGAYDWGELHVRRTNRNKAHPLSPGFKNLGFRVVIAQ